MDYVLYLASSLGIVALYALSLHLVLRVGRVVSLGHAGFALVGAYTLALSTAHGGVGASVGLLASIGTGLLVGALALGVFQRARSDYFVLATIALGQLLFDVANNLSSWTGGPMGVVGIGASGTALAGAPHALVTWVVVGAACGAYGVAMRGPRRTLLHLVAEDELYAASLGMPVRRVHVCVFLASGAVAAAGGALYAALHSAIDPTAFGLDLSLKILLAGALIRRRWAVGPLLGAALVFTIGEVVRLAPLPPATVGHVGQLLYVGLFFAMLVLFKRRDGTVGAMDW